MLAAAEALLLAGRDRAAVDDEGGGGVVEQGVDAKDAHGVGSVPLRRGPSGGDLGSGEVRCDSGMWDIPGFWVPRHSCLKHMKPTGPREGAVVTGAGVGVHGA
nr:hypothetical protein StreXyl84_13060 [Streptomyces sp. Xyl84]